MSEAKIGNQPVATGDETCYEYKDVIMTRASMNLIRPCMVCLTPTDRVFAFKKRLVLSFTAQPICDGCFDAIKMIPAKNAPSIDLSRLKVERA